MASIAVFVGIVGELIVIVSEYRDELHDWKHGKLFWVWRTVLPPERPLRWRFWFDIIATIVVLVGIVGESAASIELASLNGKLRTQTSLLRADSDQLLALINQEAADANGRAGAAIQETQALRLRADEAEAKLARITGPIQEVRIINGEAYPDPMLGNKLHILLKRDVVIHFPMLPKGTALLWTLTIEQDDKGGHHFTTFPMQFMPGPSPGVANVLTQGPRSGAVMDLESDERGTIDLTWGGAALTNAPVRTVIPTKK